MKQITPEFLDNEIASAREQLAQIQGAINVLVQLRRYLEPEESDSGAQEE